MFPVGENTMVTIAWIEATGDDWTGFTDRHDGVTPLPAIVEPPVSVNGIAFVGPPDGSGPHDLLVAGGGNETASGATAGGHDLANAPSGTQIAYAPSETEIAWSPSETEIAWSRSGTDIMDAPPGSHLMFAATGDNNRAAAAGTPVFLFSNGAVTGMDETRDFTAVADDTGFPEYRDGQVQSGLALSFDSTPIVLADNTRVTFGGLAPVFAGDYR
jgi:hypothetical protein